ncbi:hypothetical protein J7M00_06840 [bacterium]|nr:hypothetical protein [bacterium]
MVSIRINSKGKSVEDIFHISDSESKEIMDIVKYGFNTYQTPNKIMKYLKEKLGKEDRKFIYATSLVFFTYGYQRGYREGYGKCEADYFGEGGEP